LCLAKLHKFLKLKLLKLQIRKIIKIYENVIEFLFKGKDKGQLCTGTEALYKPYGP